MTPDLHTRCVEASACADYIASTLPDGPARAMIADVAEMCADLAFATPTDDGDVGLEALTRIRTALRAVDLLADASRCGPLPVEAHEIVDAMESVADEAAALLD